MWSPARGKSDTRHLAVPVPERICGCGADGHKNNYDCFVRGQAVNGWITMDLHGLSCRRCVSITLETAAMTAKGLTVRRMRTAIDARWSATAPGTTTPLP